MASWKLHFDDDIVLVESDVENNSQQESSIERESDQEVTLTGATQHVGSSSLRVSKVVQPEETLELELEGLEKDKVPRLDGQKFEFF